MEDIYKCRFSYGPMVNMAKTERGILILFFIRWTAQKIWEMEEDELVKQRINNITAYILKKFQKNQRLPTTSYDTTNRVMSTYSLLLKTLFGMKAPHKQGMDAVQYKLLKISEQE